VISKHQQVLIELLIYMLGRFKWPVTNIVYIICLQVCVIMYTIEVNITEKLMHIKRALCSYLDY